MKQAIVAESLGKPIGPYSQAIVSQGCVYVSGVLGADPQTGLLGGSISEQAEFALSGLRHILAAAHSGLDQVVKTTVFLKNLADFDLVNAIYAQHFPAPFPARSCIEVARLPKDALIEIEAIAELTYIR
ncbi:MAG: Rid family detoxifying hydrolase [Peptococcaceae bacterium]|jgi:2-iminobutanoate/2-iminopropanoate deaminase|nr:Rid family detoxifying hydrolase [Peptococcaceae bacterium]